MTPARICSLVAVIAVTACLPIPTDPAGVGPKGASNTPNCPANTICVRAGVFDPLVFYVARGTAVMFSNTASIEHNVVFGNDSGVQDVGLFSSGFVSRTFTKSGSFTAECLIHTQMRIMIHVQ